VNALVVGLGSIGRRHARTLAKLGLETVVGVDSDGEARARAEADGLVGSAYDGIACAASHHTDFDLAIIASPTHLHAEHYLQAQRHVPAVFIEKPLAHTLDDLSRMLACARPRDMVACNMRFHPAIAELKRRMGDGAIGAPLYARIRYGQHLSAWRPGQDYRASYSAFAAKGGGIVLDDIHEIDLAQFLFGTITEISGLALRSGALETDAEDIASLTLRTERGILVSVFMDAVHPLYRREIEVVGAHGAFSWNESDNLLRFCAHGADGYAFAADFSAYSWEDMYEEELAYFLSTLADRAPSMNTIAEAAALLQTVLPWRDGSRRG